jgi:hypothetical protein
VDDAVQQLALAGRLSASLTQFPGLQAAPAFELPRLSVGLHFNLTEDHGGQHDAQALGKVLRRAYARQMPQDLMRKAWREQLDAFEQVMGTPRTSSTATSMCISCPACALPCSRNQGYAAREMPWVRSTARPQACGTQMPSLPCWAAGPPPGGCAMQAFP